MTTDSNKWFETLGTNLTRHNLFNEICFYRWEQIAKQPYPVNVPHKKLTEASNTFGKHYQGYPTLFFKHEWMVCTRCEEDFLLRKNLYAKANPISGFILKIIDSHPITTIRDDKAQCPSCNSIELLQIKHRVSMRVIQGKGELDSLAWKNRPKSDIVSDQLFVDLQNFSPEIAADILNKINSAAPT